MYGLYLRRIGEDLRIRSGRIGGRLGSAAIRQQDVGIGGIRRVAPVVEPEREILARDGGGVFYHRVDLHPRSGAFFALGAEICLAGKTVAYRGRFVHAFEVCPRGGAVAFLGPGSELFGRNGARFPGLPAYRRSRFTQCDAIGCTGIHLAVLGDGFDRAVIPAADAGSQCNDLVAAHEPRFFGFERAFVTVEPHALAGVEVQDRTAAYPMLRAFVAVGVEQSRCQRECFGFARAGVHRGASHAVGIDRRPKAFAVLP